HHQLLGGAVAGALADAVDRAFHLPLTSFDGGQRIRDFQAQVVVAVCAEHYLVGAAHAGGRALEPAADLFRRGEAHRIRQVDGGRAGRDGGGDRLVQEILLGAGGVLGGELDLVDVAPGQAHVPVDGLQHLL